MRNGLQLENLTLLGKSIRTDYASWFSLCRVLGAFYIKEYVAGFNCNAVLTQSIEIPVT